jgi:hypothetical protein
MQQQQQSQQQKLLKEQELQLSQLAREYAETALSDTEPQKREECMQRIEAAIARTNALRADLQQAREDTKTVQVVGRYAMCIDDQTFEMLFQSNFRTRNEPIKDFTITIETNYKINPEGTLYEVQERFMHFQHENDALDVLALGEDGFKGPSGHRINTYFVKPEHDPTTRAKLRQIRIGSPQ